MLTYHCQFLLHGLSDHVGRGDVFNPQRRINGFMFFGSSLVVVAEGMIMVYLIARGHRHGRKVPLRSYSQPVRSVAGK
ncbi:hypothetical protein DN587_25520, partial [Escherichia coli]